MENRSFFPQIPSPEGCHLIETMFEDCGDGYLVKEYRGAAEKDYLDYLAALEGCGFEKYSDNGDGIGGTVFTATFTKDLWQVTPLYLKKSGKLFISLCFNKPLSPRMLPCEENVFDKDAKTRLHMIELWWFGNSFVIQLKNGNFILCDGGRRADARYLLDYLEALTPAEKKPVVEAWLISHAHSDHCGALCELRGDLAKRICVEGIYYSIAGDTLYQKAQGTRVDTANMLLAAKGLKDALGNPTAFYRPQTGQKYYFSDLVIEVVHSQEQLLRDVATKDINETSTWFMLCAEGQKCLLTGDGEKGCMTALMENYTKEYLSLDMMTLMHHGYNTMDEFTDYCKVKTLLLTVRDNTPVRQVNENDYLRANVDEYFNWGDGTKIMTFPYTLGSFETLAPNKWIYHNPAERQEQPNLYRYFKGHYKKEVRKFRINDNGFVKAGAHLYDRIHAHLPLPTVKDGFMINLDVDPNLEAERGFLIFVQDPLGWIISAANEEKLMEAITVFVDEAVWTEQGFTPTRVLE
ncbi:MAG: MBL fold metallo-hydrolase [Ruminococcaceae bacterium]|nr:MBL fold metallo-hydrolase [Oscillospiraceae bacterium]